MYKTVSTALQRPAIRMGFSMAIFAVLAFVTYQSWTEIGLLSPGVVVDTFFVFGLVASLTFFNLYCESQKWLQLISSKELILRDGYVQVIAGICSGFLTPNRVGEFAGRRHMLPEPQKHKAFLVTFAGAGLQGTVTLVFGLIGLLFFPFTFSMGSDIFSGTGYYVGIVLVAFVLFCIYSRTKPHLFKGLRDAFSHLRRLPFGNILKAMVWATMRYLVFSTQFVIALILLGFEGDILTCYAGVFLLYFCQSYVPGAAFGELGVRELLAVLIFGAWMPNPLLAALAGFMVWLANIALPVMIGASFLGLGSKRLS